MSLTERMDDEYERGFWAGRDSREGEINALTLERQRLQDALRLAIDRLRLAHVSNNTTRCEQWAKDLSESL